MIRLRNFFRTLYDNGDFIEQVTEQLYDAKADQFLGRPFCGGIKCGNEEATEINVKNGSLNATDLINPKSTITGETPIMKSTKHWFLPLDRYEDFLKSGFLWDIKMTGNPMFMDK
jgi:methionyl-tRNA synthetase